MKLLADVEELRRQCEAKLNGPLAVLYGGWSAEREVSLNSGQAVIEAFTQAGLEVVGIDVDRNVADLLQQQNIAHVFNALHGPYGEDGVIGGLLQFLDIGCTGSGVLASALAMDKMRSKQLWDGIGVQTPAYEQVFVDSNPADVLARLGGKAMVKPCREGSSIGMSIASSTAEMKDSIALALEFDPIVIAEQFIAGPEYSVPIVAGVVLPVVELKPQSAFYDYDAKYLSSETQYVCPAVLEADERETVSKLVERAYQSIGCSGWGRVDLLRDSGGEFYVLEVNTIPGMTTHSLVPMSAKSVGIDMPALVLNILLDSLNAVGEH